MPLASDLKLAGPARDELFRWPAGWLADHTLSVKLVRERATAELDAVMDGLGYERGPDSHWRPVPDSGEAAS